jgi:hypothetical protein
MGIYLDKILVSFFDDVGSIIVKACMCRTWHCQPSIWCSIQDPIRASIQIPFEFSINIPSNFNATVPFILDGLRERTVWAFLLEVSDDISSHSLQTRLVSIAALLSHLPAYLPVTNYKYLTIRLCYTKIVNSTRLCSRGAKSAPREPKTGYPKNISFSLALCSTILNSCTSGWSSPICSTTIRSVSAWIVNKAHTLSYSTSRYSTLDEISLRCGIVTLEFL